MQHHPDLCPADQKQAAEQYFKQITEAYTKLSKRKLLFLFASHRVLCVFLHSSIKINLHMMCNNQYPTPFLKNPLLQKQVVPMPAPLPRLLPTLNGLVGQLPLLLRLDKVIIQTVL
jgi:hypothetical protein